MIKFSTKAIIVLWALACMGAGSSWLGLPMSAAAGAEEGQKAGPIATGLEAIEQIKQIALDAGKIDAAVGLLEDIAGRTKHLEVRKAALLTAAELCQQQEQPERAMELLARLAVVHAIGLG